MLKLEKNLKLFSTILISLKCLCSGSTISCSRRIAGYVCSNFNKSYYFYKFNKFFWVIQKSELEKEGFVTVQHTFELLQAMSFGNLEGKEKYIKSLEQ